MSKYKILFIILHYKSSDSSIQCIDSLLKLKGIENCKIGVLDNYSCNNSIDILKERYASYENIEFYVAQSNLGFSAGNNYVYNENSRLNLDYVIALNNDIVIKDKLFLENLLLINHKYYIIGPDIIHPNTHRHQSPVAMNVNIKDLEKTEKKLTKNIDKNRVYTTSFLIASLKDKIIDVFGPNIYGLYKRIKAIFNPSLDNSLLYIKERENVVLHGSFLIFSKNWLNSEKVLFEPDTFFYGEEVLLYLKCLTKKYDTLYTPKLNVFHFEGLSSKMGKKNKEYLMERNRRILHAMRICIKTYYYNTWSEDNKNK